MTRPHLMKFCNGTRAVSPFRGLFSLIRSSDLRKSLSVIGFARWRLLKILLILCPDPLQGLPEAFCS